jgi:PIN domain nuclease of toxin-antitoxin system
MKLLLDTHTFRWWDSQPDIIPPKTLLLPENPKHELLFSLVGLWEMRSFLVLPELLG